GLREQVGKPNTSYASQEDVKHLAKTLEEVDRKRLEDYKKIETELLNLGKKLAPTAPITKIKPAPPSSENPGTEKLPSPDKGYEYTVKSGDTLSAIIQAYKEQGIKITDKQILK